MVTVGQVFAASRRRAIQSKGRQMTLRRLLTPSSVQDVTVQGYLAMYRPEQVGIGSIIQGDGTVQILNDEIAAVGWPGPVRARDQMIIDGRIWTVMGAAQVCEGEAVIGYTISVRGG